MRRKNYTFELMIFSVTLYRYKGKNDLKPKVYNKLFMDESTANEYLRAEMSDTIDFLKRKDVGFIVNKGNKGYATYINTDNDTLTYKFFIDRVPVWKE